MAGIDMSKLQPWDWSGLLSAWTPPNFGQTGTGVPGAKKKKTQPPSGPTQPPPGGMQQYNAPPPNPFMRPGMPPQATIPSYAGGGVAWGPQTARLGERGPEAIIPLMGIMQMLMGNRRR